MIAMSKDEKCKHQFKLVGSSRVKPTNEKAHKYTKCDLVVTVWHRYD